MTNFIGGLTGSASVDIILDPAPTRKTFKIKNSKGEKVRLPIFTANDDISGVVTVSLKDTKKYEHLGVKVALVGYLGKAYG